MMTDAATRRRSVTELFSATVLLVATTVFADSAAELIAREARASLGVKYSFGRSDETRTDCAGLVKRVAAKAGITLPRSSAAQFSAGRRIEASDLAPGDLVFFRNTYKRGVSHVGIYVGAGEFVHAASRRGRVVVSRLDESYFAKRYAGARRVVGEEVEVQPPTGFLTDAANELECSPLQSAP
jgi:cell wall-associated NlpC family hydrolase